MSTPLVRGPRLPDMPRGVAEYLSVLNRAKAIKPTSGGARARRRMWRQVRALFDAHQKRKEAHERPNPT